MAAFSLGRLVFVILLFIHTISLEQVNRARLIRSLEKLFCCKTFSVPLKLNDSLTSSMTRSNKAVEIIPQASSDASSYMYFERLNPQLSPSPTQLSQQPYTEGLDSHNMKDLSEANQNGNHNYFYINQQGETFSSTTAETPSMIQQSYYLPGLPREEQESKPFGSRLSVDDRTSTARPSTKSYGEGNYQQPNYNTPSNYYADNSSVNANDEEFYKNFRNNLELMNVGPIEDGLHDKILEFVSRKTSYPSASTQQKRQIKTKQHLRLSLSNSDQHVPLLNEEPEGIEESERFEEQEGTEEPERIGEIERIEEPERMEEPERVGEPERVEEPERIEEPETVEEPERVEKNDDNEDDDNSKQTNKAKLDYSRWVPVNQNFKDNNEFHRSVVIAPVQSLSEKGELPSMEDMLKSVRNEEHLVRDHKELEGDYEFNKKGKHQYSINIRPDKEPIVVRFNTFSTPIEMIQKHHKGKPQLKRKVTVEEPDMLIHKISKPVIQEIHEVISPYRHWTQFVKPLKEKVSTRIATDKHVGYSSMPGHSARTKVYSNPTLYPIGKYNMIGHQYLSDYPTANQLQHGRPPMSYMNRVSLQAVPSMYQLTLNTDKYKTYKNNIENDPQVRMLINQIIHSPAVLQSNNLKYRNVYPTINLPMSSAQSPIFIDSPIVKDKNSSNKSNETKLSTNPKILKKSQIDQSSPHSLLKSNKIYRIHANLMKNNSKNSINTKVASNKALTLNKELIRKSPKQGKKATSDVNIVTIGRVSSDSVENVIKNIINEERQKENATLHPSKSIRLTEEVINQIIIQPKIEQKKNSPKTLADFISSK